MQKSPTEVIIEVRGIGYAVHVPVSTYEKLGDIGAAATILTHLHVREDAIQLFGFATQPERQLFRLLISVSGIGPRMAQGILSGASVDDLRENISSGNLTALTSIPGIGKKLAERLVVELREKVTKQGVTGLPRAESTPETEAVLALVSLGYTRTSAEKAVHAAAQAMKEKTYGLEHLIKSALRAHAPK